jgi:hypothetical protein
MQKIGMPNNLKYWEEEKPKGSKQNIQDLLRSSMLAFLCKIQIMKNNNIKLSLFNSILS